MFLSYRIARIINQEPEPCQVLPADEELLAACKKDKKTNSIFMKKNFASYRVIYGDTDQMGVVYYANYLRWFELGRTEWLRQMGLPYTTIESMGLRFPVTAASCHYRSPARYDDEVTIETILFSLGRASLTFRYEIYRSEARDLLADGETRHACVDERGHVTRIPESLNAKLSSG
jgi:acyl-CoA thioester hydrolase